jgi:hypothetical protein
MRTSRRELLGMLAAGFVLEPGGKIWKPGERLISIPKQRPLTGSEIAACQRGLLLWFFTSSDEALYRQGRRRSRGPESA